MSKPPRPALDVLPFAQKPKSAEAAPSPPPSDGPSARPKDDRVTLIIRVPAADRRALKMIAADQSTTIQDMMVDAIQDIIRRSKPS